MQITFHIIGYFNSIKIYFLQKFCRQTYRFETTLGLLNALE